jgi:hypothetical protein
MCLELASSAASSSSPYSTLHGSTTGGSRVNGTLESEQPGKATVQWMCLGQASAAVTQSLSPYSTLHGSITEGSRVIGLNSPARQQCACAWGWPPVLLSAHLHTAHCRAAITGKRHTCQKAATRLVKNWTVGLDSGIGQQPEHDSRDTCVYASQAAQKTMVNCINMSCPHTNSCYPTFLAPLYSEVHSSANAAHIA